MVEEVSISKYNLRSRNLAYLLMFVMFDSADGLKYYDLVEGKGPIAEKGSTVQVKSGRCYDSPQFCYLLIIYYRLLTYRYILTAYIVELRLYQAENLNFLPEIVSSLRFCSLTCS